MANGYPPEKKVITTTLTLISSRQTRSNLKLKNVSGQDIGITTNPAETQFANCYPLLAGEAEEFQFSNNVYGIVAGGTAEVWKIEIE